VKSTHFIGEYRLSNRVISIDTQLDGFKQKYLLFVTHAKIPTKNTSNNFAN